MESDIIYMRTPLWNSMANIKFKALYCNACAKRAGCIDNTISCFLAMLTTSSVATWAFWKTYPALWALLIAISQVVQVVINFIPFIRNERDYIEMSVKFEHLFLSYEKLWNDHEDGSVSGSVKNRYFELRAEEENIENAYKSTFIPECQSLIEQCTKKVHTIFQLYFYAGGTNEYIIEQKTETTTKTGTT